MARMMVDPESSRTVRRVRRLIHRRLGCDAATVFGEAMANVREHGDREKAVVMLHRRGFEIRNANHRPFRPDTEKACGEGGYGLRIMERIGASVDAQDGETCISWWRPNGAKSSEGQDDL